MFSLMRVVLLMLVIYAAAVAETSLADSMRVAEVAPDLLALAAIAWTLTAAGPYGFLAAGVIALAGDLIGPGRVGIGAAWMLLVAYAIARLRARFALEHLFCQVPMVWVAVSAWVLAVALSGWLLGEVSLAPWKILGRAAGTGLYTALVSLPLLMIVGWLREPYLARQKRLADF